MSTPAHERPLIDVLHEHDTTLELLRELRRAESQEQALECLCSLTYFYLLSGSPPQSGRAFLDYLDAAACGIPYEGWGAEVDEELAG